MGRQPAGQGRALPRDLCLENEEGIADVAAEWGVGA